MNKMKAKKINKLTGLAAVLLGGILCAEQAEATCALVPGVQGAITGSTTLDSSALPVVMSFPFNISRLTGSSEPVGSTLYSGDIVPYLAVNMHCTNTLVDGGIYINVNYESTPLGVWAGDIGQYSGKIYNTGLDGVGFVVRQIGSADNTVPFSIKTTINPDQGQGMNFGGLRFVQYLLVKTGTLSYGTINGSQLPTVVYSVEANDGVNTKVDVFRLNFTGTIAVNKPTCNTADADKVVNLGTWTKSDFANVGSGSDWVDSSVTMVCDEAFWGAGGSYGRYLTNTDAFTIVESDYNVSSNTNNTWTIKFTSSTGLIDATQGIIALDNSNGDNATGVGIQISASANVAGVVDLTTGWSGTIGLGSSAFRIPIYARYIRTGDITAGSANGKVIYTVDYQ